MAQARVANLLQYCSTTGITIDASLRVEHVDGAGFGVYSTREIAAGQQIVFVPTTNIFTHEVIPDSFLRGEHRLSLPVHAQLAAFFAFANPAQLAPYQPWVDTWPELTDFSATMPFFHGPCAKYLLKSLGLPNVDENLGMVRPAKRRRTNNGVRRPPIPEDISLSPAMSGSFTTPLLDANKDSYLRKICDRLIEHTRAVNDALPQPHKILPNEPRRLVKFFRAWCAVNTRCFSYWKRNTKHPHKPEDPNEAMGLMPFADLFNHCAPPPHDDYTGERTTTGFCNVKEFTDGFRITAMHNIPANVEIVTAYGAHNNDLLWNEYGFILPGDTNTEDTIKLDEIVIGEMSEQDILTLSNYGYMDDYTLFHDGTVCYRTEQAAWLLVLGRHKWTRLVKDGLEPEDNVTSPMGKLRWEDHVCSWLTAVKRAAIQNIAKLQTMDEEEDLQRCFGTMSIVQYRYQKIHTQNEMRWCRQRKQTCENRWAQIRRMADRGIKKIMKHSTREGGFEDDWHGFTEP